MVGGGTGARTLSTLAGIASAHTGNRNLDSASAHNNRSASAPHNTLRRKVCTVRRNDLTDNLYGNYCLPSYNQFFRPVRRRVAMSLRR